jgi:hypothetical protein
MTRFWMYEVFDEWETVQTGAYPVDTRHSDTHRVMDIGGLTLWMLYLIDVAIVGW